VQSSGVDSCSKKSRHATLQIGRWSSRNWNTALV
jgi:hypothetical protein